jgi:hypothetical protein
MTIVAHAAMTPIARRRIVVPMSSFVAESEHCERELPVADQ